jgi:hypothetical protein
VTDLKTRIARGEYEIDSREVAGAIIDKLRMVSRARRQLDLAHGSRPAGHFDAMTGNQRAHRDAIH